MHSDSLRLVFRSHTTPSARKASLCTVAVQGLSSLGPAPSRHGPRPREGCASGRAELPPGPLCRVLSFVSAEGRKRALAWPLGLGAGDPGLRLPRVGLWPAWQVSYRTLRLSGLLLVGVNITPHHRK